MSSRIQEVVAIMQEMQDKIDELELTIKNIYKYSDPNHIHTRPNNKLRKEMNSEATKWKSCFDDY